MRGESNKNCQAVGIRTKSVGSPIHPRSDGLRLLITRFRGRGLTRDRYDVWMPSLGPSERLLRQFQAGRIEWPAYARRYRAEILGTESSEPGNRTIKNRGQKFTLRLIRRLSERGPVTLLCHCAEDEPHCHRHVLERMLNGKI